MKRIVLILLLVILSFPLFAKKQKLCEAWDHSAYRKNNQKYSVVLWDGHKRSGKAHGFGRAEFFDGAVFVGTLKKGLPEGPGKLMVKTPNLLSDNAVIVSNWHEGMPFGNTVMVFSNPVQVNWQEIKYISTVFSEKGMESNWIAYNPNGRKIGYLKVDCDNPHQFYFHSYGSKAVGDLLGVFAGAGFAVVSIAAIAAATTPETIFLLLVIIK